MTDRPLVAVGDVIDMVPGDYLYGVKLGEGPHDFGEETWRARVKHVPPPKPCPGTSDWLAMIVTEVLPGDAVGPERIVAVRCRALPGYRPPSLDTLGLVEM
jgi:hypothetical protein